MHRDSDYKPGMPPNSCVDKFMEISLKCMQKKYKKRCNMDEVNFWNAVNSISEIIRLVDLNGLSICGRKQKMLAIKDCFGPHIVL